MENPRIYLAGKVSGKKWKVVETLKDRWNFISSDGGRHSEHDSGLSYFDFNYCMTQYRDFVQHNAIRQICDCDSLVAYLDTPDSYGSIAEIASASILRKKILIILDGSKTEMGCLWADPKHGNSEIQNEWFDAYWFICSFPNILLVTVGGEEEATKEIEKFLRKSWPSYQDYLQSEEWKLKSEMAKDRAGRKCQLCNSGGYLNTHHRTYENIYNEKEMDLIVLCGSCHEKFHNKD